MQWFFDDCILWTCAPTRDFKALDLELPATLFPSDVDYGTLSQPSELSGAQEAGSQGIYWNSGGGLGIYMVERFGREDLAVNAYRSYLGFMLRHMEEEKPLEYQSPYATRLQITCGDDDIWGDRCVMAARYEEFLITFSASIDAKFTEEHYLTTVRYMDEQIGCKMYGCR